MITKYTFITPINRNAHDTIVAIAPIITVRYGKKHNVVKDRCDVKIKNSEHATLI